MDEKGQEIMDTPEFLLFSFMVLLLAFGLPLGSSPCGLRNAVFAYSLPLKSRVELPKYGDINIKEVIDSEFFFS